MKITLLDGAIGTSLWAKAEAAGVKKDPVWLYNLQHPEFVRDLAKEYAEAGAELILANTFGANGPAVKRSSSYSVEDVVTEGVSLMKDGAKGTGARVLLAAGPLAQLMEPWGDLEEDEVDRIYRQVFDTGMKAGAEGIMIQTFIDLGMMEVAAKAAMDYGVPVYCTLTFEKRGKTMMGNSVEAICEALEPLGITAIGMNCSLGPDLALPVVKEFAETTKLPIIFKPNAGKPILAADGSTTTAYSADDFVRDVLPALPYVSYIGGCCGSDPTYIRQLKAALDGAQGK